MKYGGSVLAARRKPQQARSRQRWVSILAAASELLVQKGADDTSMRDIAAAAGLPLASLYEYFPSKAAVVRALVVAHEERLQDFLAKALAKAPRGAAPDAIRVDVERVIDAFHAALRDNPAYLAIWGSAQSAAMLRELDLEDSRRNAATLARRLAITHPALTPEDRETLALVLSDATGSVLRLALSHAEPSAARVVQTWKRAIVAILLEQLDEG